MAEPQASPTGRAIRLRGVSVHNLKAIDLDLPLGRLIVITGVSGAGKSSLAFDTLHAEGQRRYVETFSPFARQFLERPARPPSDLIDGVPPALGLEAAQRGGSPRSTLSTMTQIHALLALWFARDGKVVCRGCGRAVEPASPQALAQAIDALPADTAYEIAFPVDLKGESDLAAIAQNLVAQGFTRARLGARLVRLDEPGFAVSTPGVFHVVIDRLTRGGDPGPRRRDSIETAFAHGFGRCRITSNGYEHTFTRGWRCGTCGAAHVAPAPALFRYASPLGACSVCEGLGSVRSASSDAVGSVRRKSVDSVCPACSGARLRPEALAVRLDGQSIATLSSMTVGELARWAGAKASPSEIDLPRRIERGLGLLIELGLGAVALDRPGSSLTRSELKRARLARLLASGPVGALYVIDEPTASLHPAQIASVVGALRRLRDRGNTVLVVEHEPQVIEAADHLVDLGPGAGVEGGRVVYSGPVAGLRAAADSATRAALYDRSPRPLRTRRATTGKALVLRGARGRVLKSIDVSFPLGVLCAIAGVNGSGKSTLVEHTLYQALQAQLGRLAHPLPHDDLIAPAGVERAIFLGHRSLARLGRSNPATHVKAFDEIRKAFAATHDARVRKYDAGRFSFNIDGGRCGVCQGEGTQTVDMRFLPDVVVPCPECHGARYRREILEIKYRGRDIAQVLDMTAREAFGFFRNRPRIQSRLRGLLELGLDYLRLGQPLSTLSTGEIERLRLSSLLARSLTLLARAQTAHAVVILDEPTLGLHPHDKVKLFDALQALVDRGHSLFVVTHDPSLLGEADWIIELGPGSGAEGGRVVCDGTPEQLAAASTPTGRALAKILETWPASE